MNSYYRLAFAAGLLLCLQFGSASAQCPDYFIFNDAKADVFYSQSVDGAGDIDNDGYDDIIYIVPYSEIGHTQNGVVVRSGRTGEILYFHADAVEPVAGVGDFNHDGHDDYVAATQNVTTSENHITLFSGSDSSVIYDFPYGRSVDCAGDVDNDGYLDIVIGYPYKTCWIDGNQRQHAQVYVYSGATGNPIIVFETVCSVFGSNGYGASVAGMGDLNGDGHSDIAIGIPGWNWGDQVKAGQVLVYSGAPLEDDIIDTLYSWHGSRDNVGFGAIVRNAGDVNNDGRNDIIIGRPDHAGAVRDWDSAWVYSGASGGLLYPLSSGQGDQAGFGYAVDGVGDVNHDGYDDFAVSAHGGDGGRGIVYIYSGQNGSVLDSQSGPTYPYSLGRSIAGAGDVNNDGVPDIAAIAYRDTKVHVFTCIYQSPECLADTDSDSDGRGNMCDNCPADANVEQTDSDQDGVGDACDDCTDPDHDGYGSPEFAASTCAADNCPDIRNDDQADGDSDGIGDVCDICPEDADPDQSDSDGDGIGTACDNCPAVSNALQSDNDSDGRGNQCDNCDNDANYDQADSDGDGYGDVCDNCPEDAGNQYDADSDGIGDRCDDCTDVDGDGYGQQYGDYPQTCPLDNCEYYGYPGLAVYNPDQSDVDGDGYGDPCDNCPDNYNPSQDDRNGDGVGDSCVTWVTVPADENVEVDLGDGVVVTFEDPNYEGQAELHISDNDPPPNGAFSSLPGTGAPVYNLHYYGYNQGAYTICINYDDTGMDAAEEAEVRLYHYTYINVPPYGQDWVELSGTLDTELNIVCGVTDQLSPFAVGIPASESCCEGRVGDVNGQDGDEPTIGDIALMIDAKYISLTCDGLIDCLLAADINQSGGADPVCADISLGDIAILIDYLFITGPGLGLPDCL